MDTTAHFTVSLSHPMPATVDGLADTLMVKLAKGLTVTRPAGNLISRLWTGISSDLTVNPASTQGNFTESFSAMGLYSMVLLIRKTEATSTGTVDISSDHFSFGKTITINNSTGAIGDTLGIYSFAVDTYVTGTNAFVIEFGSRVGYVIDVIITGELSD